MTTPHTILITGGHVTPALALIDAIQKSHPETELIFVGRKFNNNEKTESFEFHEVTKRNVRFIHLSTGRTVSLSSWSGLLNMIRIPLGMIRAWQIVSTVKPDLVMSFGGYLALPIAYAASFLKIPLVTHEQTIHPGRANRQIARLARTVFVAFPEAQQFFPKSHVIVSGNPIRSSVFVNHKSLSIPSGIPCVYVTGGSLGAHAVNLCVEKILKELLQSYVVIHQTGNVDEFGDYVRLKKLQSSLHPKLKTRYIIRKHITDSEIGQVLGVSDLVIGRSGANTFFELVACEIPSILIPLPTAAFDEQRKHANMLKAAGVAEVFEQDEDPSRLLNLVNQMIHDRNQYGKAFKTIKSKYPSGATEIILQEIMGTSSHSK